MAAPVAPSAGRSKTAGAEPKCALPPTLSPLCTRGETSTAATARNRSELSLRSLVFRQGGSRTGSAAEGALLVPGEKPKLPRFIVNPHARWKTFWDIWVAVLVVYSIVLVPMRVGFAWRSCIFQSDWWWDVVVDLCFTADILLNFRTAVIIDAGERNQQIIVTTSCAIARRQAFSCHRTRAATAAIAALAHA